MACFSSPNPLEKSLNHGWGDNDMIFSEQHLHFRSLALSTGGGMPEVTAAPEFTLPL